MHCLVVGSAPLRDRVADAWPNDYVVAVNGGIWNCARVDAWIVNSRDINAATWSPAQRRLSRLMLETSAGRDVPLAVFLTKHQDAGEWTRRFLRDQGTVVGRVIEIANDDRRALEADAGARAPGMTAHAISAGMFAVAWCFHRGAAAVRLEGISWEPGYAYLPGETIYGRGHKAGDKEALRRLMARYPGRLIHTLAEEHTSMAKNVARPTTRTVGQRNAQTAARPNQSTTRTPPASRQTAAAREPAGRQVAGRTTAPQQTRARAAATSVEPRRGAANRPTAENVERSRAARRAAVSDLTPASERERRIQRAREAREARPAGNKSLQVIATELTFYNNKRRKPGEVFELRKVTDFRESCMAWAEKDGEEFVASQTDMDSARMRVADLDQDDNAREIAEQLDENEAAIGEETLEDERIAQSIGPRPKDNNPLDVDE